MSAPAKEISLDQWIDYCSSLRPIENFLLIGLLNQQRFSTIEAVKGAALATPENWAKAKHWTVRNLRSGLDYYCREYKKSWVVIGEEVGKTSFEALKAFILIQASILNVYLAIAVPFTFWLLRYTLDRWCSKYSPQQFAGEGKYVTSSEYGSVYFELTYRQPIIEWVDDEAAYPLSVPKEQIEVPAETDGFMRLADIKQVNEVLFTFRPDGTSQFEFRDRKSGHMVDGSPTNLSPTDKGQHVVRIEGEALRISLGAT